MSNKRFSPTNQSSGRITSDGVTFETPERLNVPNVFFIDLSGQRNSYFREKRLKSSKKRFVISY